MPRIVLTKAYCESPKRIPASDRAEYRDALMPGLALRVSEHGHRSFVLVTRYPGHPHPTRRSIGEYGRVTIEEARETAREWLKMCKRGIDPAVELAKEREANQAKRDHDKASQFGVVLEDWLTKDAAKNVKGHEAVRLMHREIPKSWWNKPIASITPLDCAKAIETLVDRGHKAQAFNFFGYLRRCFIWSVRSHKYGLTTSPMASLSPKDLIGERNIRDRVLTDDELRAVWDAAGQLGYPFGRIIQMLMLTGARLNDIAMLSWPEVDFNTKLISIPKERMKMRVPFEIPMSPMMVDILKAVPQQHGKYVFSSTNGHRPYSGFSKGKQLLDELSGVTGYVIHDLRRTARTRWSTIPNIATEVKEAAMAHSLPGMHRVYNQHDYRDEKRALLTAWQGRLQAIVNPPSDTNVVELKRRPIKIARRPLPKQPAPQRPKRVAG